MAHRPAAIIAFERDAWAAVFSVIAAATYEDWTTGYPTLTEQELAIDMNPDNDAFSNLEEYAYGGNPAVADSNSSGISPTYRRVEDSGQNYFEFQFRRRRDYVERGLSYKPEMSSNMADDSWSSAGVTEMGATIIDADFEIVTVRIDSPVSSLPYRAFLRMSLNLSQ